MPVVPNLASTSVLVPHELCTFAGWVLPTVCWLTAGRVLQTICQLTVVGTCLETNVAEP